MIKGLKVEFIFGVIMCLCIIRIIMMVSVFLFCFLLVVLERMWLEFYYGKVIVVLGVGFFRFWFFFIFG